MYNKGKDVLRVIDKIYSAHGQDRAVQCVSVLGVILNKFTTSHFFPVLLRRGDISLFHIYSAVRIACHPRTRDLYSLPRSVEALPRLIDL